MTNLTSAVQARIGSLLVCSVVLFGLAACGTEGAAAPAPAATGSDNTLVAPRVGMINRGSPVTSTPTKPSTPTTPPGTSTPPNGNGNGTGNNPPAGHPVTVTNGTATLDWTPPTQNTDGTSLSNLAGYTVYYGTSPTQLTQSVKLTNPGLTGYTLSNLASGTWYFAVTSYSSAGVESVPSGVVNATI